MDADELAQAVARLQRALQDPRHGWMGLIGDDHARSSWLLSNGDMLALRAVLAALAEAQETVSEPAEFARAVAFLRELRAVTTLRSSPGPLYAVGYFAGIDGVISCLEEPGSARTWLATQRAPDAAGEAQEE